MEAFIVFASITTIVIFITWSRHKERMEMIKKGRTFNEALITPHKIGGTSLFLGLATGAVGMAFLVSAILDSGRNQGLVTAGLICLFSGISLVTYWKITSPDREQAQKLFEARLEQEKVRMLAAREADKHEAPEGE